MTTVMDTYAKVPAALRERRQWMLWKHEDTKVPYRIDGVRGRSNTPSDWSSFDEVVAAVEGYNGIAYVLSNDDGMVGIDLDNCLVGGEILPWAQNVLNMVGDTYCEVSPSGNGLKLWGYGTKPGKRCRRDLDGGGRVEVYESVRFFAVTGRVWCESDVRPIALTRLYAEIMDPLPPIPPSKLQDAARRYVSKCRNVGEGERNAQAFSIAGHVAAFVEDGVRLTEPEVLELLRPWNQGNTPPLTDAELREAVGSAMRNGTPRPDKEVRDRPDRGRPDRGDSDDPLPAEYPMQVANRFRVSMLGNVWRYHQGEFCWWVDGGYRSMPPQVMRDMLYAWLDGEQEEVKGEVVPYKVNTRRVNEVLDALKSVIGVGDDHNPPKWISADRPVDNLIACRNMIVNVETGSVIPATSDFFTFNALDFDYDAGAGEPREWLDFLNRAWGDDPECIEALQQWFGYCLTPDMRHHKMLVLLGPTRSGKGTIERVLAGIIGRRNVGTSTLVSLAGGFGLHQTHHKRLLVIPDARKFERGADEAVAVEKLLMLTGGDTITIDRKYRDAVTVPPSTKVMMLSNQIPNLTDESGALAKRMIILKMSRSWEGQEDTELGERLMDERPGILRWAMEGWRALRRRGRLLEPESSLEERDELADDSAPVQQFIRDQCEVRNSDEHWVERSVLYDRWRWWALKNNLKPGTPGEFRAKVMAATGGVVKSKQVRHGEGRSRVFTNLTMSGT